MEPSKGAGKEFRLKCQDVVGRIHYDGNKIPYLSVVDEYGNMHRIYGNDEIDCRCGASGDWQPGALALTRMLDAYSERNRKIKELLEELKGLIQSA